jgi:hypothetical protein
MSKLQISYLSTTQLAENPCNARTHSKKQIRQIADSICEFGFTNPILIDSRNMVLAGHGRLAAAKLLSMEHVPCLRIDQLTPAQKRAYALADNKLALNAGWNEEILGQELKELLAIEPAFDIGITGFSIAEADSLIEGLAFEEPGNPVEDQLPDDGPARCRFGDIWQLGPHRLICGNSLDQTTVATLMDDERAQMVFTDPPYNVPIDGHVGGLGSVKHREFAMASGEMSRSEFTSFLQTVFTNLRKHSVDGSIHFICMDWRHMAEMLTAGEAVYDELKNLIVWVKDNGGMGSFYRSRHELIFTFKSGTLPHLNSFELGQHGRYRTNVWQYRGVNSFKSGRADELALLEPMLGRRLAITDIIARVARAPQGQMASGPILFTHAATRRLKSVP